MNANFVFPVQPVRTPRPQRPQKQADGAAQSSRDSNSLRASVLDVALELGLGSNSLVADWMFNNAVREEDENEEPLSPKNSAPLSFQDSQSSKIQINTNIINNGTRLSPGTAAADNNNDVDVRATFSNLGRGNPVAFPDGAPLPPNFPPIPVTPAPSVHSTGTGPTKKLKKPRKGDGYESDSAYLSEAGRKSKEKERKKKFTENPDTRIGKDSGLVVDPDQRQRKRSFVDAVRGRKPRDIDVGYATDGSSLKAQKSKKDKSKDKSKDKYEDAGESHYETDGGTKKSKSKGFFKLSGKSSKPDLTKERTTTPPVPSLKEYMPLPIAQRFATRLASPSRSTPSLDETRSTASHVTSMPAPSLDESRSISSLGVSLASAGSSSKSTVNEVPPLNFGNLLSLSFQPLTVDVDVVQPPSPPSASSQLPSPPVSFPSAAYSPGIRDSRASSGSSSSGVSNPQSRARASDISTTTSNISSFTSPSTSHSHFQLSSPRIGHGLGAGSTSTNTSISQHSHGHGYGQAQRMDTFGRPTGGSRLTSPPSSGAAAAAVAGMMSFQIARDVATVPLMMRPQQKEQQDPEPLAQIQYDGQAPTQTPQGVEMEQFEAFPRRLSVALPTTAPLNIAKGGGLRIKPSLEKISLPLRKDNREYLSAGGATPSPISSSPATTAALKPPHSVPSPMSAGQHNLTLSPPHSGRSWNGRPTSPPQSATTPGNQILSPHSFISAPNTATSSPVLHTNPTIPRPPSRPRLSLNPPPNGNQLVAPNVLAYYDIPPPSPPPMGPLPVPPQLPSDVSRIGRSSSPIPPRNRSRSPIPPLPTNHSSPLDGPLAQLPSPAQLRQRMLDRTPRRLLSDETSHGLAGANIRRGKESPFPPIPVSQRTLAPGGLSSSGASEESMDAGDRANSQNEPPPRSPILPGPLNSQERDVLDSVLSRKEKRSSWIDFGDVLASKDNDVSEEGIDDRNGDDDVRGSLDGDGSLPEASHMRHVLDRMAGNASRSEESAYSERALARRRSSEVLKPPNSSPPQHGYAWDDSMTVGDRNSRWSGSIYSRMSIMDEEESNVARDRFVKRVEAMLADGGRTNVGVADETERNIGVGGVGRQNSREGVGRNRHVPPVPKIPDAFAASTLRSETVPAVRMWNKF